MVICARIRYRAGYKVQASLSNTDDMAKQRAALLLNLRREYQGLFLAREIATLSQMAAVLEMSQEKLTQLWTELPLEDAKIAALLQFTVDIATSYQYAKIRTESVDPAVKRFYLMTMVISDGFQ